jgi:hypothetical protein
MGEEKLQALLQESLAHGYEATRDAVMTAFAKSWRRE